MRALELVLILVVGVAVFTATLSIENLRSVNRLNARVSCLEHPHAESSIAATRINGRFVVTQPAHRTGCP